MIGVLVRASGKNNTWSTLDGDQKSAMVIHHWDTVSWTTTDRWSVEGPDRTGRDYSFYFFS